MATGTGRRRRPAAEVARQEILDAALGLFLTRPPHEVTVRAVMAATDLARPSFYDHFPSRAALITELVVPAVEANREVLDLWPASPRDPRQAVRAVAEALVAAWRQHGRLLVALADAAAVDPDARAAYRAFADDSVRRVAQKIRDEVRAGTVVGIDAEETALALVLMNRAYIAVRLDEASTSDAVMVETITEVWSRVLWPGSVSSPRRRR